MRSKTKYFRKYREVAFLREAQTSNSSGSHGFTAGCRVPEALQKQSVLVPQGPFMCPLQNSQPAIRFICICKRKAERYVLLGRKKQAGTHVEKVFKHFIGQEKNDWLTSLRMAHTAESLRTESRRAMMGLKAGSTAPSATPF